jgi:hypothetical protein
MRRAIRDHKKDEDRGLTPRGSSTTKAGAFVECR